MKEEILNAVREGNFYDWIANNYHRLSSYELVTILKEYVYQTERFNPVCTITGGTATEEIADELDDLLGDDDQ